MKGVLILLGLAMLFPWNAFLKGTLYFAMRLAGTPLATSFPSWISLCYTGCMVLTMFILVTWAPESRWIGLRGKTVIGLLLNMIIMMGLLLMPIMDLIKVSMSGMAAIIMVLLLVSVSGVAISFLQRGVLGMLAMLPPSLTPCLVSGQAMAGLMVSLSSLASAWIGETPRLILYATIGYFGMALSVLTAALFSFHWLQAKNQLVQEALSKSVKPTANTSLLLALRKIWRQALGILLTLTITIALLASFVTSGRSEVFGRFFIPIAFVMFDLGDLIGRWLPIQPAMAFSPHSTICWLMPMLRSTFFLLFSTASIQYPRRWLPAIGSEWWYFIYVFLFGLTNGWSCSLAFMHAPTAASHGIMDVDQERGLRNQAGALMGLGLNCGLVLGSLSSFILRLSIN